ncbi:hypothetical protein AVEN_260182-1 [Araneus ventricosus]|uniref:Uncharacterized protein n=1 Tax=Araneus ventricosus TaxID=182803 RepID=A0A4Y2DNT8_ARAVE|nr:hypothetical protein AVEN_260182-1 [Araneus ventricosus]
MLTVCQNHIKNEISKASFVSVTADESTDVSPISQLVVVFRYILSNGQPVERFWRFTNPPGHDAKSIAECIQASLEKVVAKPEKLISQNYDGTNVMCGQHAGVQAFIQCDLQECTICALLRTSSQFDCSTRNQSESASSSIFSNLSDITNFSINLHRELLF